MAKGRVVVGPGSAVAVSVASVTSSKLARRRNRAAVLRRIIYLKRRCIRCYFVNVIVTFIVLVMMLNSMRVRWSLFMNSINFLISRSCFAGSLALVLVGSVISIYSLTKKLKKKLFITGNIMITLGVIMNALVLVNIFMPLLPTDHTKYYGYPKDLVEDCEAYPDHTFKFFEKPERRKGRPVVDSPEDLPQPDDVDIDDENNVAQTEEEEIVTSKYICQEMLANIKWFERTVYLIPGILIITSATLIISTIGILHLFYIHRGGLNYSILPVALVEPYEFYDDLMRRNRSVESIPNLGQQKHRKVIMQQSWDESEYDESSYQSTEQIKSSVKVIVKKK